MKAYSRFCLNRFDKPNRRLFNFRSTPQKVVDLVEGAIVEYGTTKEGIKQIFDAVISGMEA
jgi:hypothetical protein